MSSKFMLNQNSDNYIKIRQLNELMEGHKGYIAGGVFKNIFNNEQIKDVDIFFETKEDFEDAEEYFSRNENYKKGYENKNVVSFYHEKREILVELIRHKFRKPLEMIKEFDFTITQFVYYKKTTKKEIGFGEEEAEEVYEWKIAFHERFFEHLLMKRLVIDSEVSSLILPVSTYNRMFKYGKYGYFPCRETKLIVIEALRGLPSFSDELLAMGLYEGFD